MQCPACGAQNRDDAPFCLACRATLPATGGGGASPAPTPRSPTVDTSWGVSYYDRDVTERQSPVFAGFWSRFLALWLDGIFALLLGILPAIAFGALFGWLAYSGQSSPLSQRESNQFDENVLIAVVAGGAIALFLVSFVYQLVMTARGGGWGMRIIGIRIIRADNGDNPGYGRALGRIITRGVFGVVPVLGSLLQLLDHLWMIWDADKQTWHDKAAGTYVVQR